MRNKKHKPAQSISSEDVANLTIFKNALKEANTFRNISIKKRLMQLKQSPIFSLSSESTHTESGEKRLTLRRKGLDELSKLKVNDPYAVKQGDNAVVVDNLLVEANKLEFEKAAMKK